MTNSEKEQIFNKDERKRIRFERRYSVVFARVIQGQIKRFLNAAERDGYQLAAQNIRMYVRPDDIRNTFIRMYREIGEAFNTLAEDEIKSIFNGRPINYDVKKGAFIKTKEFRMPESIFTMNLEDYIDRFLGRKITFINQTTETWVVDRVGSITDEAIRQGQTMSEQTETLQRFFSTETSNFAAYRARRIARTETVGAANFGKNQVIESVPGIQKVWIADMRDLERTRITHQNVEPVAKGERFRVGNSLLRFPGDPEGEPGEVINCRCSLGSERI